MSAKVLPANPEAERVVLGAILVDNAAYVSASAALTPLDFHSISHRQIYAAMQTLADRGAAIDTVTLEDELLRAKTSVPASYLVDLVVDLPRITNVEQWARLVRRDSLRRQIALAARGFFNDAMDPEQEPEEVADAALQKLLELAGKGQARGFLDNRELVKAALREIEDQAASPDGVLGLRTGLIDVDRKLRGLRNGTLGVLGARTGQGKSVLAMQFAEYNALKADGVVAVFSLEMSGVALTKRRLAALARVNVNRLYEADNVQIVAGSGLTQKQERWQRLGKAAEEILSRRLAIMTSAYTVPQIHSECRRLKAEKGLSLVIVDYVQLLDATRRVEKRYLEIRDISRSLVRLALELDIPVVVAAQLNREAEGRSDKRPSSADIADGDSLIRDASWCLLIHRDLVPKKGQDPRELENIAHLILSKHREGWTGTIRARFNPLLARFEDLSRDEQEAAKAAEQRGAA